MGVLEMTAEVRSRVLEIAADILESDLASLTDDTHLENDLGATSLTLTDFTVALERHFDVEFPQERLHGAHRLGEVVAIVREVVEQKR